MKTISIAAVQIDANPTDTQARLACAGRLVSAAAAAGAQLVVLPELFNTGYGYTPDNYARAESMHGATVAWMRQTAAEQRVHLAGSLMIAEHGQIYNALLLFAPDGRMWRYDKNYPWGWERAYFRPGHGVTVAETELGNIGLLVCWDVAHRHLWRQYAGQVDLMVICSCPPNVSRPIYHLPSGEQVRFEQMGPLFARLEGTAEQTFGTMINQQTAWLGVPAVNTVACGRIRTPLPAAAALLLTFLPTAPGLIKYLPQAGGLQMACDMTEACKIVAANGEPQASLHLADGDSFCLAQVMLPATRPVPHGPQPPAPLSRLAYLVSDTLIPALMRPIYWRAMRSFEVR